MHRMERAGREASSYLRPSVAIHGVKISTGLASIASSTTAAFRRHPAIRKIAHFALRLLHDG
eukprot:6207911-Pleurochrysis_carterae.AAC.1